MNYANTFLRQSYLDSYGVIFDLKTYLFSIRLITCISIYFGFSCTYLRQSYLDSYGAMYDVKTYLLFKVTGMSFGTLESYVEQGFHFSPIYRQSGKQNKENAVSSCTKFISFNSKTL